ncbi:MAG: DUF3857 domain-containing protein [Chitinophagales bacterium]
MTPYLRLSSLTILFSLIFNISFAGGWDDMEKSDHIAAEANFLKELKKDSTNVDALIGMIFISEMKTDYYNFEKHVGTLLRNHPNPEYFKLFGHMYDDETEDLLANNYSSDIMPFINSGLAVEAFNDKDFTRRNDILKSTFGDVNWSVIGPFENIAGSSYDVAFWPEPGKEKTNNLPAFQDNWVDIENLTPYGELNFAHYLPFQSGLNTYYAQTNLILDEDQDLELRLARNLPVKIWVDDELIFENSEVASFIYDYERLSLSLSAGTHNVLIKMNPLMDNYSESNLLDFYEQDDNQGGNGYFYTSSYNYDYSSYASGSPDLLVRFTDKEGKVLDIETAFDATYTSQAVKANLETDDVLEVFKKAYEEDASLKNLFLYVKTAIKYSQNYKAEEIIAKEFSSNKPVAYKYLLGKLYGYSGKEEKMYNILENIDQQKSPIFPVLWEKFDLLDYETDEDKYLTELKKLQKINPAHYSVCYGYIDYYTYKGDMKARRNYVEEIIENYPHLEEYYEDYLEDDDYKPYEYKDQTDEERREEADESLASMDTSFYVSDYTTLIDYYKHVEDFDSVILLYDILIEKLPYLTAYHSQKGRYLYIEEKYDEAYESYSNVLKQSPYNVSALEKMGDIRYDQKNNDEALAHYNEAIDLNEALWKPYSTNSLIDKVIKIKPQENYKNLFQGKTFKQIQKEKKDWIKALENEDFVGLMYTRDIIKKQYDRFDIYQSQALEVLTEEGASQLTEISFSHFGSLTDFKVIKKSGAEVIPDNSYGYLVFKNLEPGDIIYVEGVSENHTTNYELGKEYYVPNTMNVPYPLYYSRLEMAVPEGEDLTINYSNIENTLQERQENGFDIYSWEYTDVAKVVWEDAMLGDYDDYARIDISSMADYSMMVDWYKKKTYRRTELTYEVKEALDSLDLWDASDMDKAKGVYNYITKHINYSYVSFLQSNFTPKQPGITCSEKIGDCKDVATLMITMLRELDVDASYVLVRTINYSFLDLPPYQNFDHVIVAYYIDGKEYFADLTSDAYPYYSLNLMDNEAHALRIKDGETYTFQLPNDYQDAEKNTEYIETSISFDQDFNVDINMESTLNGINSGYMKEVFRETPDEEIVQYLVQLYGYDVFDNNYLKDYTLENLDDIDKSLVINLEMQAADFVDNLDDLYVFQMPLMRINFPSQAFNVEERYNDIYLLGAINVDPFEEITTINIPDGYEFPKVPKDIHEESQYGSYDVTFELKENQMIVNRTVVFNDMIVEKENFQEFVDYYKKLVSYDTKKMYIVASE